MPVFFRDDRTDFAHAFPEICVRPVAIGIDWGEVVFVDTLPTTVEEVDTRKWYANRERKAQWENK